MTKRLSIFEFVSYKQVENFPAAVAELVKILQEEISRLNKTNIDAYAPEGVRAQLRTKANEVILKLANLLKTNPQPEALTPDIKYLEDILYILAHFKSEVETVANIKAILGRAKQLLPNEDTLFNRATNAGRQLSDYEQVIPSDPNMPAPTEPSAKEAVLARANYLRRLGI